MKKRRYKKVDMAAFNKIRANGVRGRWIDKTAEDYLRVINAYEKAKVKKSIFTFWR